MSQAARTLTVTLVLCVCVTSRAEAAQKVRVDASFKPEKLGAATTVSLGFQVSTSDGRLPAPLTTIDFHYPRNLGFATSGLGLDSCQPATLEADGANACPGNSLMGSGSAQARFQIGPEIFEEGASLAVVAGPSPDGYVRLLVSATGVSPVAARIVMSTVLLPGRLQISVPLVPSLPGGSDVAVVAARVTLGGNLIYHERRHGKTVAVRPRGIVLPRSCPRGGFRFAGSFSFLDGTRASARTVVRCPVTHARR
jgi:hypothetical protein